MSYVMMMLEACMRPLRVKYAVLRLGGTPGSWQLNYDLVNVVLLIIEEWYEIMQWLGYLNYDYIHV